MLHTMLFRVSVITRLRKKNGFVIIEFRLSKTLPVGVIM